MKKTVRFAALALCGCMITAALAGCGGADKKAADNTVVLYMRKPVSNMTSYDVVMEEANKKFREELGVELEIRFIESGMYDQKLNVMTSSGDEFDMCQMGGNALLNAIESGAFIPLDDLLDKYGKDILAQQEDIIKENGKYKGKTYAVQNQGALSASRSFVFKKDLVERYGFDYKNVKSLKDLEPYLKEIKDKEPGIIPLFHGVVDVVNPNYVESEINGIVFDENKEEFVMKYDNEYVLEQARTMHDFYKKGYIASDAISRTDSMSELKSGQYAVMNNNGYYSADGSKSSSVYGYPCVETYAGNTLIRIGTPGGICVSSTSKHPEKCIEVLNLIWKDTDLLNTLAYGVEGVNYTVNEERTKQIGSKSINVKSGNEQTWAIWHNWLGPLFNQWDSEWNSIDVIEEIKKNNQSAPVSKSSGFIFESEPVKAEVAKVTATYQSVYKVFEIGCMEDFDEYLADTRSEMQKSGIDTVLAEMNKQYKEWKQQ